MSTTFSPGTWFAELPVATGNNSSISIRAYWQGPDERGNYIRFKCNAWQDMWGNTDCQSDIKLNSGVKTFYDSKYLVGLWTNSTNSKLLFAGFNVAKVSTGLKIPKEIYVDRGEKIFFVAERYPTDSEGDKVGAVEYNDVIIKEFWTNELPPPPVVPPVITGSSQPVDQIKNFIDAVVKNKNYKIFSVVVILLITFLIIFRK